MLPHRGSAVILLVGWVSAQGENPLPEADVSTLSDSVRAEIVAARAAAEASPEDPEAVGELGMLYFGVDTFGAAGRCFERAAGLSEEAWKWWYYAALSYRRAQEIPDAVRSLEQAVGCDYAPVYVELAALIAEAEVDRAAELCRRALALDPDLASAHAGLGRCAVLQGHPDEALAHFRKAVELRPDYASAHYELAMLLVAAGKRDEAAEHMRLYQEGTQQPAEDDPVQEVLRNRSRKPAVIAHIATGLLKEGEVDEAASVLESAAERNPDAIPIRGMLGFVYLRQGRVEKAIEVFQAILAEDPSYVDASSNLATAYEQLGETAEAERVLLEALGHHPESGFVLHHLGKLTSGLGRHQEALDYFERAVAVQPGDALVRLDYALALERARKGRLAMAQLRSALEIDPGQSEARLELGQLLKRTGDRASAEAEWKEVIARDPHFAPAYLELAGLAQEAGDFSHAEEILKRGLAVDPESPQLAARLAWLYATSPTPTQRNGAEAVRLAELACTKMSYAHPECLDILAAAYAEAGRFEESVKLQRRAIRRATAAKQTQLLGPFRQRLELYESGRPFRMGGE